MIGKINASIWFQCMETSLIEDKRKDKAQRAQTRQNPKRHIPEVSLLLWHEMVPICCFVWPPALKLWSGGQSAAGSQVGR